MSLLSDARQQKAEVIAATAQITGDGLQFRVPSQTMNGHYAVKREPDEAPSCTCPDHELRRLPCKHILAVEIVLTRATAPDGTVTETRAARVTYAQNWPAYNAAQTTEKEHFCRLSATSAPSCRSRRRRGVGHACRSPRCSLRPPSRSIRP